MLWTDATFITVADLTRLDAEVSAVASSNEITLTGDDGLIRGTIEESSIELQKLVTAFGGYLSAGDLSSNHLAAVLNIGGGNSIRQKALLQQVVVSGDSPNSWNHVKQWAVFWCLQLIYRNAFNRTVKDRYEGKMRYYASELKRRVTPSLYAMGIPIVIRPLSAPGAKFERDAGVWDSDNVSQVAGSGTASGALSVAVTYMDMSTPSLYVSPASRGNAESNPSERVAITLVSGNVIAVDITSLVPPNGTQHPSQLLIHVVSPLTATHWNVYVGTATGLLYLQNPTPIPIATKTYTLTGDWVSNTATAGEGQYSDRRLSLVPSRQRA